jgi:hypothetical protein
MLHKRHVHSTMPARYRSAMQARTSQEVSCLLQSDPYARSKRNSTDFLSLQAFLPLLEIANDHG